MANGAFDLRALGLNVKTSFWWQMGLSTLGHWGSKSKTPFADTSEVADGAFDGRALELKVKD